MLITFYKWYYTYPLFYEIRFLYTAYVNVFVYHLVNELVSCQFTATSVYLTIFYGLILFLCLMDLWSPKHDVLGYHMLCLNIWLFKWIFICSYCFLTQLPVFSGNNLWDIVFTRTMFLLYNNLKLLWYKITETDSSWVC